MLGIADCIAYGTWPHQTTADRRIARRKSDRRHVHLYSAGLHAGAEVILNASEGPMLGQVFASFA